MSKWGLIDNTIEGRMKRYFPHFMANRVPVDLAANIAWRNNAYRSSKADQKVLKKMCKEDALFWTCGFVYLFDAGDESGQPGPMPFVPYEFQVECIAAMWAAMHDLRCPIRGKKPRKIGFSWLSVVMFQHCWQFFPNRHLLVGSHREEEVDSTASVAKGGLFVGEWSKLMPKFDFIQIYQPPWLLPPGFKPRCEPYRTRMKIVNPENGSIIFGTSASSQAAHGERGWAALWDEAAKTENLYDIIGGLSEFSPCKFWISTIGNLDHPFSTILKDSPGIIQLNPEWWMHPLYSIDLTIDKETGRKTSPWLRRKLDEIGNDPILANQQYYADETMQTGGFYTGRTFMKMGETMADPFTIGELDVVDEKEGPVVKRMVYQQGGRWKFWLDMDATGKPPSDTRYIFGIDVAAGSQRDHRGSSNSVIAVVDWRTGWLVAEFVVSGLQPFELARIVVASAKWFEGNDYQGALIVPERNGPGESLIDCIMRRERYFNVWQQDITKKEYGWYKTPESGRLAFGLHQEMICDGRFTERSYECIKEMHHYQHNPTGKGAPIHAASTMTDDPSGARDNHGDRVIARICACQALQREYEATRLFGEPHPRSYRGATEAEEQATNDLRLELA